MRSFSLIAGYLPPHVSMFTSSIRSVLQHSSGANETEMDHDSDSVSHLFSQAKRGVDATLGHSAIDGTVLDRAEGGKSERGRIPLFSILRSFASLPTTVMLGSRIDHAY